MNDKSKKIYPKDTMIYECLQPSAEDFASSSIYIAKT